MNFHKPKGQVVAFEGIDFAGKSTLIEKVIEEIQTRTDLVVPKFNEPRRDTPEYEFLRKIVISPNVSKVTQIHVSIATRVSLYEDHIMPLLKEGVDVITDRCLLTSMVYQQDSNHKAEEILALNVNAGRFLHGCIVPRVIVYLDLTHDEYLERLNANKRSEVEDVETYLSKKENFDRCLADYRQALRHIRYSTQCKVIESNDPFEIVTQLQELGMFTY